MREMMLALWVFGLLVSASDIDTPRALMLVSSVLQDEPQTTTLGGTKSQSLERDGHSQVAVIGQVKKCIQNFGEETCWQMEQKETQ
jgi:hypothetical protein